MKRKRGQIALFVIIAIVIVGGFLFYFFNVSNDDSLDSGLRGGKEKATKDILYDCFKFEAENSLIDIGLKGGYYGQPISEYLDMGNDIIPFYYYDGLSYIPTIDLIELETESLFYINSFVCLDLIEEQKLNITYNYRSVNVEIRDDKVVFLVDLELIIYNDEQVRKIDFIKTPIIIPSKLKAMSDFASDVSLLYEIQSEKFCMSCFIETASYNNLSLLINTEIDSVLSFSVLDNETGHYPILYRFLASNFGNDSDFSLNNYGEGLPDDSFNELNIGSPTLL